MLVAYHSQLEIVQRHNLSHGENRQNMFCTMAQATAKRAREQIATNVRDGRTYINHFYLLNSWISASFLTCKPVGAGCSTKGNLQGDFSRSLEKSRCFSLHFLYFVKLWIQLNPNCRCCQIFLGYMCIRAKLSSVLSRDAVLLRSCLWLCHSVGCLHKFINKKPRHQTYQWKQQPSRNVIPPNAYLRY